MKEIKHIGVTVCLVFITTFVAMAQNGLYLSTGATLILSPGTKLVLDSLVLVPSNSLTLSGPVTQTRNSTITHHGLNTYIKRAYNFSNIIPSFTGAITIYYRNTELNNLAENSLTLDVNDNANWRAYNANVTRDTINNFVTTSGLSNINLNELTLTGKCSLSPPISIVSLSVACNNGDAEISWSTAQEFNSKNFEVQKNTAGDNWEVVGSVKAAGVSASEKTYFLSDNKASNNLYRVVVYDINGRKTISSIVKSNCSSIETFAIYPNPIKELAIINISTKEAMPLMINLLDMKGAVVKHIETHLLSGKNKFQINMSGLANGSYKLIANWGSNVKVNQLIKE